MTANDPRANPPRTPADDPPPAVRSAVRRDNARSLVLLSLISFALSVILTRLYLHLAGYPMIANDVLHIAHVLWGGLLLFIGSLLPLMFANRWALRWCAILGGVGMGLFIDEVGKFITMANDYHFPYAAPIIYATFLLSVQLYLRVRGAPDTSPRGEMYRALEQITEVLDSDLDAQEREAIERRLVYIVKHTNDNNLKRLAGALYDFVEADRLRIVPRRLTRWQRIEHAAAGWFSRVATQPRLKVALIIALAILGAALVGEFSLLASALPDPFATLDTLLGAQMTRGQLDSAAEAFIYLVRTGLQGLTGVLLLGSAALVALRREGTGLRVASSVLIFSLSVINLLVWYFDQFSATTLTLSEFFILLGVIFYRRTYLKAPALESHDPVTTPAGGEKETAGEAGS